MILSSDTHTTVSMQDDYHDLDESDEGSCATPATSDDSDDTNSSDSDADAYDPHKNCPSPKLLDTTVRIASSNQQHKGWHRAEREDIVRGARERHWDLLCLQEVQRPNVLEDHGTHLYRSGPQISKGVCLAFVIGKNLATKIKIQKKNSSPGRYILEITIRGHKFLVVNVHRPHSGQTAEARASFDDDLLACLSSLKLPYSIVGDFNARTSGDAVSSVGGSVCPEYNAFLSTQKDDGTIARLCQRTGIKGLEFRIHTEGNREHERFSSWIHT